MYSLKYNYYEFYLSIFNFPFTFLAMGEVTVLVPVPDFKSAVSWLWSGKVSSILMLSRHFFNEIEIKAGIRNRQKIGKSSYCSRNCAHIVPVLWLFKVLPRCFVQFIDLL